MNEKYLKNINDEFLRRKIKNPRYSMRKFAIDAGFTQAYFSMLFSGKRELTLDNYAAICKKLSLPFDSDRSESLAKNPKVKKCKIGDYTSPEFIEVDAEKFKLAWFDLMIADLSLLPTFKPDVKWVSKTLKLKMEDVISSFERLTELGILEEKGNGYSKKYGKIHLKPGKSLDFIREYHRNMIRLAGEALQETSEDAFKQRYISGASFNVSKKDAQKMKKKCENFIEELVDDFSKNETSDCVYQINLQLFPLSK